nr:hypothetical protein [Tanacetum cinerariifolium]
MAPVTRQGQNPPPPNINISPHHMTPELMQAMIDQALLRNSTNEDGSQSSHEDNPRHVQTTRPCFYADFMKCHPFNFKGNKGVTLGPEAYAMTWEVLKKKMTDKYCPHKELKKLKIELWNLRVKGNDVSTYTNRFQELTSSGNANVANAQRDDKETPKGNGCFKCGASGHFKRDCPKLKNKNGGNSNAQGWVYAVKNAKKNGNAPRNPDSNVITGTFLLNNCYASILFDTSADRSFISIAFTSLVNIDPTPLGSSYDVELAAGKIVGIDTIIRGCTINFQNHPFNIDLMPVEQVQTPGNEISILLAVGTPSTGSGNLYCQWKLSPGSGKIYILLSSTHNSISLSFDAGLMAQEEEIGRLKERVQVLEDREAIATKQSGEDAPIKGRSNNEREAAAERISNDSKEIARVLTSMDAATILAGETNVPTGSGFILTTGPLATVISTGSSQVSKSTEKANDQEAEEGILYGCDQKQLGLEVQRFQRLKRKGLNLEMEQVKKQKSSEEPPEIETTTKEFTEDKIKEIMQLNYMHALVEWKLYDLSGVHHVTAKDKEIFMLVEKDYPL